MATVIFDVASQEEFDRAVEEGFGGKQQPPRIRFASSELMFRIMTARRWQIVRRMAGAGPMSIRELARRLERDVKGVHGDVHVLLDCGVLSRTEDGRIVFPFDAVHVDVMIEAA